MTKEPIMIDCEYCIVLGNENKCKALQTETHTCLGITAKNKCPIYKLKQQLKRLDNEYEGFAVKYTDMEMALKHKEEELNQLKADNEKMSKGYEELTEIVSPYIDDFTGYNEELKGFDIVLCVKELMQQLDQLKAEIEKEKALKQTYLACYKTKHKDVKGKLFKYETYKQALQEIKDYCNKYPQNSIGFKKQILQKCEVTK